MTELPRLRSELPAMEKIDRLGWTTGFSLQSYGVKIGIRSNNETVLTQVVEFLPSEWRPISNAKVERIYSLFVTNGGPLHGRRFNALYGNESRLARSRGVDEIFDRFESDLRLFVAEHAKNRVFVHAGVVAWKGRAIVIPGRSYTGKSTLVAELVRAGATYYSDEYAVFDSQGRVHPFAKPLELRNPGEYSQSRVPIADIGGKHGTKPLPVGLVIMTRFDDGDRWRPRRLTPGKGVLELLSNTVSARRDPKSALHTLEKVAAHATVLKGSRGEAEKIAPAILRKLENLSA